MNFKVPCEVDDTAIVEKIKTHALKEIHKELSLEIKNYVREEFKAVASQMDFREIAEETLKKAARSQMVECLERIREDEYMKFRLNGKEVEPSAEKLYNLLTAYASYTKILNSKKFRDSVMEKAVNEIADRITNDFDARERYEAVRKLIQEGLDSEE